MDKLVSLIIPVYNTGKFIRCCLESVLAQTYNNIEVILVDDGSTDNSLSICQEFALKDNRINIIHKQNEGVSAARNVGMDAASGSYICFADSDDVLMPDYVEYLVNVLENFQVSVAVTTSFFTSFGGSQTMHDKIRVITGEDAAAAILYYHIPIGCYCKIFKRDFIERNHIRFIPDVYIGEGFNFNVHSFCMAEKVAIGHRKIYCYRRDNTDSAMTKFKIEKCEMALKAIDIIRDNLIIKSEKLYKACDFALWHTSSDMYNWMSLAKVREKYPEMYSRCFNTIRRYSWQALMSPINKKEKFRATLQLLHPYMLVLALKIRQWKFKLTCKFRYKEK